MTSEELKEQLQAAFGSAITHSEVTPHGECILHVAVEQFLPVMEDLKQNKEFNYLSQITGVDYLEQDREPRFDVVYELFSLTQDRHVRVHVGLPEDEPTIPSVLHLWKGADFPEREIFDMFGITVAGHPNLKRLIMPEGWEGHPLLKDYPLTVEEVAFSHNPDHKSELIKTQEDVKADPWA